ncbi:hypothetical protein AYO47_01595 [Planctomyces sp. SCGC AG-212-M04]|nr:hypothetical protein AYO47_01595 [Planctomyces sp. SCGC AG-212-M04]
MVTAHNRLFGTTPIVVHAPGPLSDGWRFFAEGVFESPIAPTPSRHSFTLITWNGDDRPAKPNGLLENNVARFGVAPLVLRSGSTPWKNIAKLALTAKALEQIDTEFVIGLDSADVLVLAHPDEIVDRFIRHFSCDLVFNATGSRCWPERPAYVLFESNLPEAAGAKGRHWLNSGAFVGRTDFCKQYFAAAADAAERGEFVGDQDVIKAIWPDWHPQVHVDYRSLIFQWFNEDSKWLELRRPIDDIDSKIMSVVSSMGSVENVVLFGFLGSPIVETLLKAFPKMLLWNVDSLGQPSAEMEVSENSLLRQMTSWWARCEEDRRFDISQTWREAADQFPDDSLDLCVVHKFCPQIALAELERHWLAKLRAGGSLLSLTQSGELRWHGKANPPLHNASP